MSNLHVGLSFAGGIVDHSGSLANDIGLLYLNDEYSDVTLTVAATNFHAHRVILAARSQYFRALLFGGLRESHQAEVEIKDANLTAFKVLLKYIYTGWISLSSEKEETVLDILGLAHQYGFEELESAVCDYLKETLCISNVCIIYDMAALYTLNTLKAVCQDFMDKNALPVLTHESFYSLSPCALKSIISRDSFCAPEVYIFQGVHEWVDRNTDLTKQQIQDILSHIRLPLISLPDLLNVVRPTSLISADQLLDAIKAKSESRDMDLQYRGYLMPGENVAVPSKGAQVLQGEMRANLLDGNVSTYDMDRGFTRHPIDDNNGQGILVKLGMQCIINHIRLMLWDRDQRGYSYYIEVSMDQKDWVRVVDHTRYHCRSWQYVYFSGRVVRYIRIVGTNNTVNRVFHVVAFEAYYTKEQVDLHKGLIVPRENIALVGRSALVIEGVSRARNNLLNGDIHHYDWDSGYTCHQLGSGSICVQLGQPYYLSSCKLLLWDCDDRSYSYYIEASVNYRDWELIVDKTREACRSWQTLTFTPRPIVYFKIVGTFNTANEVFHCVHFETPAQLGSENRPRVRGLDHAVANVFHCVHFETPAQLGSENRPRVRGLDHAVANVRPHPSNNTQDDAAALRSTPSSDGALPLNDNPTLQERPREGEVGREGSGAVREGGNVRELAVRELGAVREGGNVRELAVRESVRELGAVREGGLIVREVGGVREGLGGVREGGLIFREGSGTVRELGAVREVLGGIREVSGVSEAVREGGVIVREGTGGVREVGGVREGSGVWETLRELGAVREQSGGVREQSGGREVSASVREQSASVREQSGGVRDQSGGVREQLGGRELSGGIRELSANVMKQSASVREQSASVREQSASVREVSGAGIREGSGAVREQGLREVPEIVLLESDDEGSNEGREGRNEGSNKGSNERRNEGRNEGIEGRNERSNEGRNEGSNEGIEGRNERSNERSNEGSNEGRNEGSNERGNERRNEGSNERRERRNEGREGSNERREGRNEGTEGRNERRNEGVELVIEERVNEDNIEGAMGLELELKPDNK